MFWKKIICVKPVKRECYYIGREIELQKKDLSSERIWPLMCAYLRVHVLRLAVRPFRRKAHLLPKNYFNPIWLCLWAFAPAMCAILMTG